MKGSRERTRLADVVQTQKGYAFKSAWYTDSGRPIVKVSDFTHDSIDCSNLVCIPDNIAAEYLKYELGTGDVVVQTVGSWPSNPASVVGRCVRIPETAAGALLNQNAVKLSPSKYVDPRFLYYLLRNEDFKTYIIGTAQGAASQAAITLESIRAYEFDRPSLPFQRRVAGILSAYDDLIENNQRRIKILEEMARSLYREWFVNFRFPGHERVPLVDSLLGPIPKGWEVKRITDLCESVSYGFTASASREEVGPKFLRITDIVPEIIDWDSVPYCEMPDNNLAKYLLLPGDIVVARTGATTGYAKRINKRHPTTVFASYLVRVRTKSGVSNRMLGLLMESADYKKFIKANIGGAAQPQANAVVLSSMPLLAPPPAVAQKFDALTEPFFDEMEVLGEKSRNLRRTRDVLLPRLLSEQINLKFQEGSLHGEDN